MVYRAFFTAVKLEEISVFLDKSYKMSINLVLYFGLSFFDWLFVLLTDIFVIFEALADFLWLLSERLFAKLA